MDFDREKYSLCRCCWPTFLQRRLIHLRHHHTCCPPAPATIEERGLPLARAHWYACFDFLISSSSAYVYSKETHCNLNHLYCTCDPWTLQPASPPAGAIQEGRQAGLPLEYVITEFQELVKEGKWQEHYEIVQMGLSQPHPRRLIPQLMTVPSASKIQRQQKPSWFKTSSILTNAKIK